MGSHLQSCSSLYLMPAVVALSVVGLKQILYAYIFKILKFLLVIIIAKACRGTQFKILQGY